MSLGGRPKEVEQHSYRAAKQLLPGRPPKLIHTLTPSSRHLTHRDAATWCARPSRPRVAGPSPTALHPAVLALMRGCMPNTACPGPAHADYSASRLSDSSPSRGLPLLLPSVRHRLSDSSPSRGLPLSALVRHQRSVSSATWPFLPFCGTSGASALPLGAGTPFCPLMALPRLAALAERQLCRT